MYALALRLTGNEHDARDVLQDAYLRAFRSIHRFRGDARITTWLYRIVANTAATHHSKRRRRREAGAIEPAMDEIASNAQFDAGSDGVIARVDERARLVTALDALTDTLRIPIVLHDVYGLTHDEIAESIGITRSASKVRLHRARRQLRGLLSDAIPRQRRERVNVVATLAEGVDEKEPRAIAG